MAAAHDRVDPSLRRAPADVGESSDGRRENNSRDVLLPRLGARPPPVKESPLSSDAIFRQHQIRPTVNALCWQCCPGRRFGVFPGGFKGRRGCAPGRASRLEWWTCLGAVLPDSSRRTRASGSSTMYWSPCGSSPCTPPARSTCLMKCSAGASSHL